MIASWKKWQRACNDIQDMILSRSMKLSEIVPVVNKMDRRYLVAKLNQIIAVVNGKKTRTQSALTEIYHKLQKPVLFEGLFRRYEPSDEEGDRLPSESKRIQYTVKDAVETAREVMAELINVVATQDYANCKASADVVVDGQTILRKVPVTHLLFLEKQVIDLRTFISKIPTLDLGEQWEYNEAADAYATQEYESIKTKKVPRNHVKAEATEKHPAQVEVYHEDVKIGTWYTTKFSGAIPAKEKNKLLNRVDVLAESIKLAREEANNIEVDTVKIGHEMLNFVFGK